MKGTLKKFGATKSIFLIVIGCVIILSGYVMYLYMPVAQVNYSAAIITSLATTTSIVPEITPSPTPFVFKVTHVNTPEPLKAVYYTSWAAGHRKFRAELFDLIKTTEINAVVIDVKDYTGRISFEVEDPELKKVGASERRIPDIKEFIGELHKHNIYVIGRISSFQDSYMINIHPEWAVKTEAGAVWQDYKGVKWLDPGAKPAWEYLAAIGREAYSVGFDELNFDYIRFPSDGNLKDISYDWRDNRSRSEVLKDFFIYLNTTFGPTSPMPIPISADLFGLTTSSVDDLGIGQVLEDALPYFDYVYPMVYPSHFSKGYLGYTKPSQYPYEVIKYAMERGIDKAYNASTTAMKLRPWLQAFNLGGVYTPAMVRSQIQATYDTGLTSWLLWNAGSVYNKEALLPKEKVVGRSVGN